MKRTYQITGYGFDSNPNGTLNGNVRVGISLDIDGTLANADVVKAVDGTEETITDTLATHIASQAARETGLTLTVSNVDFVVPLNGDVSFLIETLFKSDSGLELTNDADADHDIQVATGQCKAASDISILSLDSALTKQIDAVWAVGNNAGGLFTGTVAANTTYHFFLIRNDSNSSTDAGFDISVTAANIPSGYSLYRRIGSMITDGSANIRAFTHKRDTFIYVASITNDISVVNHPASSVLRTLTLPIGIYMNAIVSAFSHDGTGGYNMSLLSAANTSTTGRGLASHDGTSKGGIGPTEIMTNLLAQIRTVSSDQVPDINIYTHGWVDIERGGF